MPQASTSVKAKSPAKGTIKSAVKAAVKAPAKVAVKTSKGVLTYAEQTKVKAAKPAEFKCKIGEPIKFRGTRTGLVTEGRFAGRTTRPGSNGDWYQVNIAPKGKPAELKLARLSQIIR